MKAKMNPDMVFISLYHHVADIDSLRECYHALKGNKSVGVDDVTKSMYAEDLEANLQDLSARLKRMGYCPLESLVHLSFSDLRMWSSGPNSLFATAACN